MYVVGLKGSPRKKGSTDFLLTGLLSRLEERGAQTRLIDVCAADIQPCREYKACEKKGFCPISDDMEKEIYGALRKADIIIMASPVFFFRYHRPAQGDGGPLPGFLGQKIPP
ncbi:MAG: flavodoxin family protein [Desulfarculaceae bacterium]|nr:flavodoxin family protein [Desulfarculaceae bacterium]